MEMSRSGGNQVEVQLTDLKWQNDDEKNELIPSDSSKFFEVVDQMGTLNQPDAAVMRSSGQDGVDWDLLGVATSVFCDAPGVLTMAAPVEMERKRRKLQEKRKRQEPSTSVKEEDEEKKWGSETDANMSLINKLVSENPEVNLERLLLDRRSFSQTLENILCMSYLVKEGRAKVKIIGGHHVVVPGNVPSHEERGRGQDSVFRFDLKDWRYMKESVQEGTELLPQSGSADKAASGAEAIQKPVVDDSHHVSRTLGGGSVMLPQGVEPQTPTEKSTASMSTEDAVAGPVLDNEVETHRPSEKTSVPTSTDVAAASSSSKKKHKKKVWKKNRGKQKATKEAGEPEVELLSIRVEEPPPAPGAVSTAADLPTSAASSTVGTPTSAALQESGKKLENEDHKTSENGPKAHIRDSAASSAGAEDQASSQAAAAGESESVRDILDFEDEQKYEIKIDRASTRPALEWGLCVEDDRETLNRTPPRTPPSREPRLKNKGQAEGREQPSSPGARQVNNQGNSPRDPWKRKLSESRGRHEPMRSTSLVQPPSPSVSTIDASKLEGLSEWNRIKAMQQHSAGEVASHKNWIPRKGIQRNEGGDHSKGRGKAKQGRGEQSAQLNSSHHAVARQKFDADLKLKQEELLQRSKQSLKAEIQKAKRIETARKGRDELEQELERNLVYRDGELIYLNQ